MSRFRSVVVATVFTLITTLAVACGGDQSTAPPNGPPNEPPPVDTGSGTTVDTATVPATVVDSVAAELYLHVAAGEDVTPEITGILAAFMPVLGEADETKIESLLAAGQPFAVDFQAGLIAQSFQNGTMFTVDNFVDAAVDAGATALDGATPITREYLTAFLTPVAQQSTYTSVDVLPALVLALGRARIQQTGAASTDAVWSDGLLDPLQVTLLMYAVQFASADDAASSIVAAGAAPAPTPSNFVPHPVAIGKWALKLKGIGFGIIGSIIGKAVQFPIGPLQSAQATICASVMLNSYKLQMSATQRDLWHRDPSHPAHPYQSQITAALTFNFVPNALGSWLLPKIGCPIPPVGAAPGKSVTWSTEDPLPDHGGLIDQQLQTDANGEAQATYQTVNELVPGGLQATLEKSVTGLVKASASGLVPGWKRLEATLDYLTPVDEGVRLNVQYHEPPQALDVTFQTALSLRNSPAGYDIDVAATGSGQIPLVHSDPVVYGDEIPVSYQSFDISTVNPQGCDRLSPASTTNGTLYAQLSLLPDSSGQLAAAVTGSSTQPIEHVNVECGSTIQTNYLVLIFSAARLDDTPAGFIDSLVVVAPGDLKGTINRTVQDAQMGTITEQTTIELRVVQ